MPDTFNCPNCGAPLDYQGNDPIIRCPFCSSSVIVPSNLRSQPAFSSQPHNFTIASSGNLGALINQARRFKEVRDLAMAGNMDEAVRVYIEITGASLNDARSSVEALARGMPVMLTNTSSRQANVNPNPIPPPPTPTFIANGGYEPASINEQSMGKVFRWVGCSIGCLTAAIVLFILVVTLVPTAAGLAGMYVGFNPKIVLTMLPILSTAVSTPKAAHATVGPAATKPMLKTPTSMPAPTSVPEFASQVFTFGKAGTSPGSFTDIRAIAVDPIQGTIFAAGYSDGRIQAFDPQGNFIVQWVVTGSPHLILAMACDHKSNLYAVVSGNILVYNSQGKLQATLKPASVTDYYQDIAILPDGTLMVISRGENVLHLSPTGKILSRFDKVISNITKKPELNSRIAVDGNGNFYLLGTFSSAVFVFNAQGKAITHFGSIGDATGQFRAPLAIAVDPKSRIYVSDIQGIQVFSNDGTYINVLNMAGPAFGLVFDEQGFLYLSSNQTNIDKFQIP